MTKPRYTIIDYAEYKWEFLRRNKDYIKAYNNYAKHQSNGDHKEAAKIEKHICNKWYISELFDPSYNFEKLEEHLFEIHKKNWSSIRDNLINGVEELSIPTKQGIGQALVATEILKQLDIQSRIIDNPDYRKKLIIDKLLPPPKPGQGAPISLESDWGEDQKGRDKTDLGVFKINVNIKFPEEIIVEQFRLFIDKYKNAYRAGQRPELFNDFCTARNHDTYEIFPDDEFEIYSRDRISEMEKFSKKQPHFDDYKDVLDVYDKRMKERKAPKKVQEELGISKATERDRYNNATTLINKGLDPYRRNLDKN